jgi:hypothetical protein
VLHQEANDEAVRRRRRSERALTVDWDDVYKCARCGRPVRSEDALMRFLVVVALGMMIFIIFIIVVVLLLLLLVLWRRSPPPEFSRVLDDR